jgi:hypothetical protein
LRAGALVTVSFAAAAAANWPGTDAPGAGMPSAAAPSAAAPATEAPRATAPPSAGASVATGCLPSGDGYLRARVAGAIDAKIDWPNSGTRCEGEAKSEPPGVRLSFHRDSGSKPDLLFVFGITGVREGQPAHEVGVNLTLIVQGTTKIYGTLGDSRCTVDSLTQRPLPMQAPGAYRVEARGFCTQPAHAVRGSGAVLVSTFEFAGLVNYGTEAPGEKAAVENPAGAGSLAGTVVSRPQSNLEKSRPVLAGDEQAVAFGVIRDAVQHTVRSVDSIR